MSDLSDIVCVTACVPAGSAKPIKASVTRMTCFWRQFCILKPFRFHDKSTVLNERKHLKIVIRSVPTSVNLFLDRTR
jgi:hypothetical protein